MKKFICLILCILMIAVAFSACGENKSEENEDGQQTADTTEIDEATVAEKQAVDGNDSMLDVQTYEIEAPYCTLKYPAMWEDAVSVSKSKDGNTLSFVGKVDDKSFPLFDLAFDSNDGISIGTFKADGKEHTLSVIAHDIDKKKCSDSQYQAFSGMQEDVNVIIANLKADYELKTK